MIRKSSRRVLRSAGLFYIAHIKEGGNEVKPSYAKFKPKQIKEAVDSGRQVDMSNKPMLEKYTYKYL